MRGWLRDLGFAWRSLRRAPSFTLTAVGTIGVALGITSAIFAVVQKVLIEPLPYDHRGEHRSGARPYFTAPILSWHADRLSVLYQRRYIESAQRFADAPRLTDRQIAALEQTH